MSNRSNSAAAKKNNSPTAAKSALSRQPNLQLPSMTLEALEARVFLTVSGFEPAVNYTTGTNPRAIATGDFAGNGRSDLVVVNQTSDTINVLMANPNGTFQSPITLTDSGSPNAVAVGDFLGNGHQDIAVTNQSGGTVSIYLGNGAGSFSAPATYSVGSGPDTIVSADLNNDGRDDLAIGTFSAGNVVVLLANSNGTSASNAFTVSPSNTYSLGAGINGIAAGTLSTDGYADLAVTNVGGTVTILHNDQTGHFTSDPNNDQYNAGVSPEGVVIGNFRESGDIAIADNGDGTSGSANVTLLQNQNANGDGYTTNPSGPYAAGAHPSSIVAAVFNGQGREDLAVTDDTDNTVSLLYNNNNSSGGAVFAAPVAVATGHGPDAVAIGDFNADGQIDLAVANKTDGNASVLLHSAITITSQSQSAVEGAALTNAGLATFTDNEANASPSDFTATVNWGDGTSPTSATIQSNGNGGFTVVGSHTYANQGVYTMSIAVADADNDSATTTASTVVADAALTASALTFAPTAGASFTGPVATFTDADPNGAAKFNADSSQYSAIIAWGDGHSTTGVITANSNNTFSVSGTHTYQAYGSYSAHVTIVDSGGSSTNTTSSATVADAAITATGSTITGTEGSAFSGTIGTFTDANTFTTASYFTAALTWGDGNTSTGTVIKTGPGQYSITGSHTYADAGTYSLSFTASDSGGATNTATTSVQINNAALASALTAINSTEGTSYTGNVATFTDANTQATASHFTALITWPGLTTSTGLVTGSNGSYTVSIPSGHTFNHAGTPPVSVLITGAGGSTTTAVGNSNVSNAALSGTLSSVTATEGTAFTGTLATFTDANTAASHGDFTATITWDDSTTSAGTVLATGTPGTFAVTFPAGHTFTRTGSRAISIAIAGLGGGTASAAGNVTVSNASISAAASTVQASNGNAFSGAVATFSDPNTAANALDFGATIHWGDGTSGAGTITNTGPGTFSISGTHTWTDPGTPTIVVNISGNGGGTASTSQNATVTDSPITLTTLTNSVVEAATFNGTIATFTDGNPQATTGQFTSSINWGDNTAADTTATITESNGIFSVVGTHSYTATGSPSVTVAVSDNHSQTVNSSATMTVGYATVAATLATITATEGTPYNGSVATFTDSNTSAPASEFAAVVTFPGGNTTTATISQTSPGHFLVNSGFTFTRAGSRPVSVVVTDPTGATTIASATGTAAVTSAGVSVTGGSITATQGGSYTGTVATFADAYAGSITPASAYTATITWDNTSQTTGTVSSTGNGGYSVTASHVFQTAGTVGYSVSVNGPGMGSPATGTGSANVANAGITATMATISTTEGTPFTGTIATFSNADASALDPAGSYTATITYDNNTTASGTVTALGNGAYSITGTHTFNTPGTRTESVSIAGPGLGSAATASTTATIANAGITVSGGAISPTEGSVFSGTIATFADANASTTLAASAYTVAVSWPGGGSDSATVTALGGGQYAITDSHTFNRAGPHSYSISVSGPGMTSASTGTGTATITSAGITGSLASINSTEGASFAGTVATFADNYALSTTPASAYGATITWDNNTTSTGVITSTGNGGYSITASHTFQTPGSAPVSIAVSGPGLSQNLTITGNATIAPAALNITGSSITATEGTTYAGTIATFTTADPSRVAGDFTATVNWGDGSSVDSGTTISSLGNNTYAVVASGHTFAIPGSYSTTINVTEGINYQTLSGNGQANVGYATVSNPTISSITATEGTPWSGTIGTFTDSNTSAVTSEFRATITWSDQSQSSAGFTLISPGHFAVTASNHTFASAGTSAVAIGVYDTSSNLLSSRSGTVHVGNAALSATGTSLSTTAGNSFTGPVATFTDANTLATAADFSATVSWGDGTPASTGTAVTITQTSPGAFQVIASHAYSAPANNTISVSIVGAGGGSTTATTAATVGVGQISISTITTSALEGESFTNTIATFTDSDPQLAATDFTATADWTDGTPTGTLTIVPTSTPGEFSLVGTHTYAAAQGYWAHVIVQQNNTGNSGNNYTLVGVGYQNVAATLATITATEGSAFSGTVATFSDANTTAPASEFAATVTWPNASTTYGTVTQTSPGQFAVTVPNHTFTSAADSTVSIAVTTPDHSSTLASNTGSATVTSAGVTVTGGSIAPTQGTPFTGTIATFADAYAGTTTPANDYTAHITWDSGSVTTGTIASIGNGQYSVVGTNTFQSAGNVGYALSITGPGMAVAASGSGSATVASAAITATMATITATEGALFAGTIATFSDADTSVANTAGQYTATITYDNSTSDTGTVTALSGGVFAVTDSHTFEKPGTRTESISIIGPGISSPATASGSATIANAGLTVTGASIAATQNQAFTGTVGTFEDANPNSTLAGTDYAATITWSGGGTSTGTITSLGGGNYSISASNTFHLAGTHGYTISVTGPGMQSPATGIGSAAVANAGISSGAFTIDATEGTSFGGPIVGFTSSDTSAVDPGSAYTATIHWGDGHTSTGSVIATSNGAYVVTGSHVYDTANAALPMSVTLTGAGLTAPYSIGGVADVASAGISATLSAFNATEGTPFTGAVATFADADTNTTILPSAYTAYITWPGNVTTAGVVSGGVGGIYTVTGTHLFNAAGQQPISVNITGPGGATATASGTNGITTAGLATTLATITAAEGGTFTGTIATFTDADASTTSLSTDYSAVVSWGGASPVTATISALGNGAFAITASHTFMSAGTPTVAVIITGPGNGLAYVNGAASITSGTLAASATPITAAEGAAFTGTIATFTDSFAGTTTPAGAFNATITWGDSSTSAGTITSLGGGEFAVSGVHTYTVPGSPLVGVSITGPGGGSTTASTTATVSAAAITATTANISATEGASWSGTVAMIHSADVNSTVSAGQYAATITWPDQTQSAGTITALGGGVYGVAGNFTFHAAGSQPVLVSITGPGSTSTSASDTASIASAGITAALAPITGTEGSPFAGTIATFADADPLTTTPASAYSAMITYASGATSTGTITAGAAGTYTITGSHTFNAAGLQPVHVSIAGPGGASATATGTAGIGTAGLTATLATVTGTEGSTFAGTVATFTDADVSTTSHPGDYTALIAWSGGTPTPGTITSLGGGVFAVSGTHTFAAAGNPSVSVSITGPAGGLAFASGTAAVASGTLSTSVSPLTGTEGISVAGTIATFSDSFAGTTSAGSAFTAAINWGDGSSLNGLVTALGNGQFAVSAAHLYTAPGSYTVGINIAGPGSATAITSTSATISPAAISASGAAIASTGGAVWSGTVATIHSADLVSTVLASQYSATITWPDNSTSTGVVTALGGGAYGVAGTFTFHTAGSQNVQVAITGPASTSTSASAVATIASAGITAALAPISLSEGGTFSGPVATFTDADAGTTTPASSYNALITWPGNVTSTGTITAGVSGSYTVSGSHTFNAAGVQPVSVVITGPGGAGATATGNAGVASAGLSASLSTITTTEGGTFAGTVATFSDTNIATTTPASAYTALISWAGATPVVGTVASLGGGAFAVTGSHLFTAAGNPSVSVSITGPAGGLAYAAGTASVTSGTLAVAAPAITATEGTSLTGTIATFTDSYTATTSPAGAFIASITWGDGISSAGTVTALGNGHFAITATHTYSAPGSLSASVGVSGPGGGSGVQTLAATVAPAALSATAATINATQGLSWTGTVATLHIADAQTTILASALTATITWPGGSTSSGTITAQGAGNYKVNGAFTFPNAGSQSVHVVITGPGNTSAEATDSAIVSGGGILAILQSVTATEGQPWTGQIARFVSPNATAPASAYSASITWEDGTTTTGQVLVDTNGGFDINASHTFANSGFAPVSIAITGPNGLTASVAGYEKISAAGLVISNATVTPVEGVAFTGPIATFVDANAGAIPGNFTAVITWSDNTTSAGTVAAGSAPGSFVVTSPHIFAHSGHYPVQVTVTSAGGASVSTTETAAVSNAALSTTVKSLSSVAGSAFAGTIATFSDANLSAYSTDFLASVNFGDGATAAVGTISPLGNGTFAVVSSHTYTRFGSYPITVSVSGAGGGSSIGSGAATVTNASLASSGIALTERKGVGFTVQIGKLYSANPYLSLSDVSGTVSWGDKQSSSAILAAGSSGSYQILGSHTYAALGKYNVSISLNEAGGGSTSVTTTVTVANNVSAKPPRIKAPKPPKKIKTKKAKKSDRATDLPLAA